MSREQTRSLKLEKMSIHICVFTKDIALLDTEEGFLCYRRTADGIENQYARIEDTPIRQLGFRMCMKEDESSLDLLIL